MYPAILGSNTVNLVRLKFIQFLKINKPTARCFNTIDKDKQVRHSQDAGGIKTGDSIQPVKIAFTSYESTNPTSQAGDCPIIIMHGLLGSKGNWNSLSKVLHSKTKRKVIAVDARNHGDSSHSPQMTYEHLVEDIKALMEDLHINKAAIIGHSMGGRAMMLMSLKYPHLVEKLVVVDISPVRSSPNMHVMTKYFDAMDAVQLDTNISLSVARKSADEQLARDIPDPGVRQFILTNLVEAEGGKYKWRVDLFAIASNFISLATFPDTPGIVFEKPTLFIAGGRSDYIKTSDNVKILGLFSKAKLEVIADAGHWVHAEKPNEFVALVTDFLTNEKDTQTKNSL